MTVTFHTTVLDVPPSPLGLLPGRILIEHHCTLCRAKVPTDQLAAHACAHDTKEVVTPSPTDLHFEPGSPAADWGLSMIDSGESPRSATEVRDLQAPGRAGGSCPDCDAPFMHLLGEEVIVKG